MKSYFLCLVCSFSVFSLLAQSEDASIILHEAKSRSYWFEDSTSYSMLERAYGLLKDQPASLLKVNVIASLSCASITDTSQYDHLAAEAVAMAEELTGTQRHPAANGAFLCFAREATDFTERQAAAVTAFEISAPDDPLRYQAALFLGSLYGETAQTGALDSLINSTAMAMSKQSIAFQELYGIVLNDLKMEQAALKGDVKLAIEYGNLYYQQLLKNRPGKKTPAMLHAYSMAMLHDQTQENDLALEWAQKGLDHFGPDSMSSQLFFIHYVMGNTHSKEGRFPQSIYHYERGLEMLLSRADSPVENIAVICSELAYCYRNIADEENALRVGAIPLQYDPNVKGLYTYAFYLERAGKLPEALQYIQRAIQVGFSNFRSDDLSINPGLDFEMVDQKALIALMLKGRFLTQLAQQEPQQNWWPLAESTINLALAFIQPKQSSTPGLRSAELMGNYPLLYNGIGELLNTLERRYATFKDQPTLRAFLTATERVKANNLIQSLATPELPPTLLEESLKLEKERAALQQALDLATTAEAKESSRVKYLQHNALIKAFEDRIHRDYSREDRFFYNVDYSDFSNLERILTPEQAVLSYTFYRNNNQLYISYTDQEGTQLHTVNQPINLADEVAAFVRLLRSPLLVQRKNREQFAQLGQGLYAMLVAPFAYQLATKKELIVVPNLSLEHLPFEALLTDTPATAALDKMPYLLRTHAVSYAPSVTTYLQLRSSARIEDNSLVGFAPVFENPMSTNSLVSSRNDFAQDSSLRSGLTQRGFSPLPYSKREVTSIYEILGAHSNQRLLLDQRATAQNFRVAVEKPLQFIHIATHGLANKLNPTLSGLACYEGQQETLLYANDIQFLPLQADLVVLSSCDSGLGELALGEGILALGRTFLYAGANNVITSKWKISDKYSSQLMIAFYQHYLNTGSYTQALRKAKLELLDTPSTTLPRYWSPFLLTGAGS